MTSAFKNVTNGKVRELKNAVQNLNTDKKSTVSINRFFPNFFHSSQLYLTYTNEGPKNQYKSKLVTFKTHK